MLVLTSVIMFFLVLWMWKLKDNYFPGHNSEDIKKKQEELEIKQSCTASSDSESNAQHAFAQVSKHLEKTLAATESNHNSGLLGMFNPNQIAQQLALLGGTFGSPLPPPKGTYGSPLPPPRFPLTPSLLEHRK